MIRVAFAALLSLLAAVPGTAASREDVLRLWAARDMDREIATAVDAMQAYGDELDASMLLGKGGAAWDARVQKIFAPERIVPLLQDSLAATLSDEDVGTLTALASSPAAQAWQEAFLAAQAELIDPEAMDAAIADLLTADEADQERIALLRASIDDDTYLDRSMAANLNYYTAFLRAALADGAFGPPPSETTLFAIVRNMSGSYRERAYGEFLALSLRASKSLTAGELTALNARKSSQEVTAAYEAMFVAYGQTYGPLYVELGQAVSAFALASDL